MIGQERGVDHPRRMLCIQVEKTIAHPGQAKVGAASGADENQIGKVEIEAGIKAGVVGCNNRGLVPHLSHQVHIWFDPAQMISELGPPFYRAVSLCMTVNVHSGIKAKAVDSQTKPELSDGLSLSSNLGIVVVEIRHAVPKQSVIMSGCMGMPDSLGPRARGIQVGVSISPDIVVPVHTVRI